MSDEPIKHAKVTTTSMQSDGSLLIEVQSHFEELAHESVAVQRTIRTSRKTLLSDVIDCLAPILKGSPQVMLTVSTKHGEPAEIVYRVTTLKKSHNRR